MEWPLKKIAELCEILDSKRKPITKKDRVAGPYPYYGASGVLDYVESFIFDEDLVLVGEDGAKWGPGDNSAFRISGKTWVNNHAHVLRPNRDKVLDSWLIYYLNGTDLSDFITGLTVPKLNQAKLKKITVPIPTLSEQKRIVELLDTVFANLEETRAKTEQNLKSARELFESTCSNSIFSTGATSSCTVQDVANSEKGSMRTGPFGSQLLKREIVDSGIAVLGIDNAVKNSFQWGAKRFITPEKFEELSRFEVKPRDVLITIMGTCGRCAIVPENIPKAISTKHLCCITLDTNKCLPEYLHAYFLYHPVAKEYLLSRAKGAIMAGLNMGIIKELPLVLPCIEEQEKLVSQVNLLKDNIDKLVMTYEAKLVSINELKKSILQKAFSGELTHK
ncbi:restriction endonuclease subunit S [Vibrio owensii]|uniref:restriction endonuclease subunit S n=1 Tax=Vibrio owensii TaxID=696485 RepID=UPI003DA039D6